MKTKILTLIVLLGIAIGNINAQGFVWAESFGTNGDDVLMAHKTDNVGNHYMAGYFSGEEISFGDIVLTNSNGSNFLPDLFLVKFDSEWNALWAYSPDDDADAYKNIITAVSLGLDDNGNCYLTGSFRNQEIAFGTQTLTNNSNLEEIDSFDTFIVKFNTDGAVVWATSFGNEMSDKARSIITDPTGNFIYVSGWFYSETIEIGGISHYNDDNTTNTCDIFMAKYSADGDFEWATTAGGDNIDRVQDMDIDENGNVFMVGTFKGHDIDFGGDLLENTNTYFDDGFVVKYSPDGAVLMTKKAAGMMDEIISTVEVGQNGNYYLGGTFLSAQLSIDDNTISNHVQSGEATYDAFVAKYNNDDGLVWLKRYGGLGNDALNNIAVDELDNVYLTGGFSGEEMFLGNSTLTNNGPEGTFDLLIAMLNPYGNLEWIEGAGGIGNDIGMNIIVEGSEEILVDCVSDLDIAFGSISMENQGGMDMYVAKFTNNLNLFSGKVFFDLNKNGAQDEGETNVPDMLCEVDGNYYSTDGNGEFEIYLEPGSYTFNPQSPQFFESVPANMDFAFSAYGELSTDNLFALQATIDTTMLEFEILSVPSLRKGQEFLTYYSFKNVGTMALPDTKLALPLEEDFNYISSTPEEESITNDSIFWGIDTIQPFEEKLIIVKQQLDTIISGDTSNLKNADWWIIVCRWQRVCWWRHYWTWHFVPGIITPVIDPETGDTIDSLCSTGWDYTIDPETGDTLDRECNDHWWWESHWQRWCWWRLRCWIIGFPWDPNDITVSPSDTIPFTTAQLAAREPLEYQIRFQNVGNDTCFNTVVLDTISDNLDLSTFEMVTASHDYSVAIDGRVLKFTFNNILLPDSTTNEPQSHGYIKYRILPYEDLEIGDSITNRAYIYFDYEAAVITNIVSTKIGEMLGVEENEDDGFQGMKEGKVNIFPNPFDNTATIMIPENVDEYAVFEVYDISGRKVKAIEIGKKKQFQINRGTLKTGMYIYMLKNQEKNVIDRGKMIIN